ncbi:MAG: Gfo/Idh/MocA family oxidoreductase [Myxococcaceae bacterium]|nr:Gfo/Idh/MocA family oxidoreductase [Myxococcaceae bacterium]
MRAAIIGLGRQGLRHVDAYAELDGVQVTAVCDLDSARIEEARKRLPGAKGYASASDLLRAEKPELLSVVSLAPTHGELVVQAAELGARGILCEKPITTSLAEADTMIEACRRSGTMLAVNHSRRWWEPYQRMVKLLRDGSLGRLVHLQHVCGGGRLGGVGSHAFDVLRMLVGSDAVVVRARLDADVEPDPRGPAFRDPGGVGEIEFASGVRASVNMGKELGLNPIWDITCTDGMVRIDEVGKRWRIQSRAREHQALPTHRRYSVPLEVAEWECGSLDMVALTRAALRELASGAKPSCSGEDGRASLELVCAFHASERAGRQPVALPLVGGERAQRLAIA